MGCNMTWATRWQRIRDAFLDFADIVAIGRGVEAGQLTVDQARDAILQIGTDREHRMGDESAKQDAYDLVTD